MAERQPFIRTWDRWSRRFWPALIWRVRRTRCASRRNHTRTASARPARQVRHANLPANSFKFICSLSDVKLWSAYVAYRNKRGPYEANVFGLSCFYLYCIICLLTYVGDVNIINIVDLCKNARFAFKCAIYHFDCHLFWKNVCIWPFCCTILPIFSLNSQCSVSM